MKKICAGFLLLLPVPVWAQGSPEEAFEQIVVPLEVLPHDPSIALSTSGRNEGLKVEVHLPLRAAGAIVVQRAGQDGEVLPLALVGSEPAQLMKDGAPPTDRTRIAWCEHDRGLKFIAGSTFACWQDLDGDGRLETQRVALAASGTQPLSVALIGTKLAQIEPRAYRVATAGERITYDLEYIPCGPLAGGLYRRKLHNSPGVALTSGCPFRAEPLPAAGEGTWSWRVDRVVFTVDADGQVRLFDAPATGTLLDRIATDEPIVDLGSRPRFDRERRAAFAGLETPPFQWAERAKVHDGAIARKDVLIEGIMRYGYTGRLTKPFVWQELLSSRELEAGSPVYGVPMGGSYLLGKPSITWCSPQVRDTNWVARCLVTAPNGGIQLVERQVPAYVVTTVGFAAGINGSRDPLPVEAADIDFGGPLRARYSLLRWTSKTIRLRGEVLMDGEVVSAWEQDLPLEEDGSARLSFGEGRVRLVRSGKDGAIVSLERPIYPGETLLPACFDDRRCRKSVVN